MKVYVVTERDLSIVSLMTGLMFTPNLAPILKLASELSEKPVLVHDLANPITMKKLQELAETKLDEVKEHLGNPIDIKE